jgi:hypothetical protein
LIVHRVSSTGTHWSRSGVSAFPPVRLSIVVSCTGLWFSPRDASLSSFGSRRARFPALSGTMKALRLPTCVSMVAYWFASTAHAFPPVFVFRCCAPGRSEVPSGPGPWFRRPPTFRLVHPWTQMGSLRSSGDPSRASAPFQDPGRTDVSSPFRSRRCCPRYPDGEGFGDG